MSEEKEAELRIRPIKISLELRELSAKQRKAVLGLIKDMGFVPEEVGELAVLMPVYQDHEEKVVGENL